LQLPYLPSTMWSPLHKIQFAGTDLCRTLSGVLAKLWKAIIRCICKIAKSDYYHCHVHLSTWNKSASTGRIFMKFDIWAFF
jgi:hypothetical protein